MTDMSVNLRGRSMLTLLDYSAEEIDHLLTLADKFKVEKDLGLEHRYCRGKNVVLLFEKPSTRTRCAFEVAAMDLGMGVSYIGPGTSQMGKKESVADTARVLGRMFDGIEYRGFKQSTVETLARFSGVPVWNGLTDSFHPTQVLADLMTIKRHFGRLKGLRFTYMGDARNNMGNSLMIGCAKMGLEFTACAPKSLFPEAALTEKARDIADLSGGRVTLTEDAAEGARNADIICTDTWVSMGEAEEVWEERISLLKPYQVNSAVMEKAADGAIFMHCLPAFHNAETGISARIAEKYGISELEVTDEVFESDSSLVFDEAENRLHTIKALMYATLCDTKK